MPYIFKDTVKFEKKINPKKLQFGSKIDNNHKKREQYHRVKEIISPNKLILDDDLKIKLLGVAERKDTKDEAVKFLKDKTKGQRVFIKFDSQKFDEENNLLCYLYLQNKTFINSHLIKNRIVGVDTSVDYKYQSKFLKEGQLN